MTKLQKQLSRKVGDKEYAKYVTVIPPKIIEKAGLKDGDSLNIKLSRGRIVFGQVHFTVETFRAKPPFKFFVNRNKDL